MKLKELEAFFDTAELPKEKVRLNSGEICYDAKLMVESHLQCLRENPGNKNFLPHYERLMTLVNYIKQQQQ